MYIGIDGGGTRGRAVLVDEAGLVLARAEGPAGIIDAADPARGAAAAIALVRALLAQASQPLAQARPLPQAARPSLVVRSLCCGLAGAGRPEERAVVRAALSAARLAGSVHVVGDAEAAMADAFGAGAGVLVIAGTGSIAWGRAESDGAGAGSDVRVGGWGRVIGDEGSGWAMGVAAIRAVLRAADGRDPATALTGAVLGGAGCAAPDELVGFAARATKAELAALARPVLDCAAAGDQAAQRIRDDAVRALVELAVTAARRAGLTAPPLALAGGLIEPGGALRSQLVAALVAALPGAAVRGAAVDAALGAAAIARHAVAP